jgi:apolipoprotein N-acyltransferase
LVFPLTITLLDWVVSFGPLGSGMTAAYSQYGSLPLMQLASVTGIWGITFLMAWFAPVANELWEQAADWRHARPVMALFTAVALAVVLFGSARIAFAPAASSSLRVAGLPHDKELWAGISRGIIEVARGSDDVRGEMRAQYELILGELFARTRSEARAGAELVVWSEVAAHILQEDETAVLESARALARDENIYLQIALNVILRSDQHPYAQNRALLIAPSGALVWDYYKTIHPFGDNAVFAPGPGVVPVADTPFGRLATVICFDADFPGLMRQVGHTGTALLLVPSHDWEAVKQMHAQVAVFRAIENGVAMFRPTGDGISLATDAFGRVLASADDFVSAKPSLVVDIPLQAMPTVYARVGDLFVYLCAVGWLLLVVVALWRPRPIRAGLTPQPAQP